MMTKADVQRLMDAVVPVLEDELGWPGGRMPASSVDAQTTAWYRVTWVPLSPWSNQLAFYLVALGYADKKGDERGQREIGIVLPERWAYPLVRLLRRVDSAAAVSIEAQEHSATPQPSDDE